MAHHKDIDEYITALSASTRLGHTVAYHKTIDAKPGKVARVSGWRNHPVAQILAGMGIDALYTHQYQAIQAIRKGRHVVVATPTASGKTIIYNFPLFEKIFNRPDSRALYIFPLKALAQDQLKTFQHMAARCPQNPIPTAAIYDGDTSAWHRKKIRNLPPNVIMTNPEMIHLAFLAFHEKWGDWFSRLEMVVVDEVHTYRGVMGSHMAQIFRRLRRICAHYGSDPTFVFSSATIANPKELTEALAGVSVKPVVDSGAPVGKRHMIFINPDDSPAHMAIMLLKSALHRELRTIVYTQSRKLTELIAMWAGSRSGAFKDRISAYRAGFLPEERREVEQKLLSGELLAVISTSALELGIDIGDLDLCLLVGYPGTVMSTLQRGGRVGRGGSASAVILIAGEDALDQYFMRHPDAFFSSAPESAVINPHNPNILEKHLVCAAAELPLCEGDMFLRTPEVEKCVFDLEKAGRLLRSGDGQCLYAAIHSPHREVDLRGSGSRYSIVSSATGEHLGEIDGFRAFSETHPGAIYLHKGVTFRVDRLDLSTQTVAVTETRPVYYTRSRGSKDTEILEVLHQKQVGGTRVCFGRLKVTDQITGYEKIHIHAKKRINLVPLDLPPRIFETEGIWFVIPQAIYAQADAEKLHFMGGIHALEHAAIGICPLFVLTDRNDFGGISIPYHPQVEDAAVFIYDSIPGGIGLSRQAFDLAGALLEKTREVIASCPCETGCPCCVHSPKCGSGNRPIDKAAALFIIDRLMRPGRKSPAKVSIPCKKPVPALDVSAPLPGPVCRYGVLDIETQCSADEVGGWHMAHRMKVSCAIVFDSKTGSYLEYRESDVGLLLDHLRRLDLVVGFNIKRFDYRVLSGYTDFNFRALPTLDLLETVHARLGYRLSLNHLAKVTLGLEKNGDGLQALRWWKEGRICEIIEYCKMDVKITLEIFNYGCVNGYILFCNKAGQTIRIPVDWSHFSLPLLSDDEKGFLAKSN